MPKSQTLTTPALSKDLQALFDLDIRVSAPKPLKNLPPAILIQTDVIDSCSRVPIIKDVKR